MRYKNKYILLLLLLLYTFNVSAQKLELLLKALNDHKNEDTVRLNLLNRIAEEYQYTNIAMGLQTADSAIALAQKLNNQSGLADAYQLKGENYYSENIYEEASELFQISYNIYEKELNKKGMANCLNDMGNVSLRKSDNSKAIEYYNRAMTLNKEINNKRGAAINLSNLGSIYKNMSDYNKALTVYQEAVNIYEKLDDKRSMAITLGNIGSVYINLSDYPTALEFCQRSLKIYEQLPVSGGMANPLSNIGVIYIYLANYPKALEYFKSALAIDAQVGIKDTSVILNRIGMVYEKMLLYDEAIKYCLQSIKVSEELGSNAGLTSSLNNLGFLYYTRTQYLKAWNCYQKGLHFGEQTGNITDVGVIQLSMGELCRDAPDSILIQIGIEPKDRYVKTLEYLNQGKQTATNVGSLINERYAWEDLDIMYERENDFSNALSAYKNYIVLRDKIINNEKDKKISRLTMQYEFDKKADSIELQKQIMNEKLKQQTLFAKQQQQQLALNQKELALSKKDKDLQKLAYLKTQADLQNEHLEKQKDEKQLIISEKEKQLQQVKVKTLTQEKTLNVLKQQQQWFYIIGGIILLGLGTFYFFYRIRLHENRLKTEIASERIEQHQKEAEFQQKLGDISLSALRSQMNPHFIFNCLNSIKLYTSQNDTVAATEYLTKFSKLIRLVLENSRNDRITLASELDALRLYMEMEAMRFKEKLKYNISVKKDVDLDYIEIPPLLLQPYVENAIWHGLMQKEEGGCIDIAVGMQPAESMLVINITDDGIGRAKSAELMSKTTTKHKSYGMKVTSERLALINRVYKTGANVTIYDLTDNNGQSSGTQVTIKIPIE